MRVSSECFISSHSFYLYVCTVYMPDVDEKNYFHEHAYPYSTVIIRITRLTSLQKQDNRAPVLQCVYKNLNMAKTLLGNVGLM